MSDCDGPSHMQLIHHKLVSREINTDGVVNPSVGFERSSLECQHIADGYGNHSAIATPRE